MKGFKIRKGDLITAANQAAIVTKKTANYIYFLLDGREGRVRKSRLWQEFDTRNDISLHYRTKKNRRRQRRMRTLDLHGIRHENVDDELRKFLNFIELPCRIIIGRSDVMRTLTKGVVSEYGWYCHFESTSNPGALIVTENE